MRCQSRSTPTAQRGTRGSARDCRGCGHRVVVRDSGGGGGDGDVCRSTDCVDCGWNGVCSEDWAGSARRRQRTSLSLMTRLRREGCRSRRRPETGGRADERSVCMSGRAEEDAPGAGARAETLAWARWGGRHRASCGGLRRRSALCGGAAGAEAQRSALAARDDRGAEAEEEAAWSMQPGAASDEQGTRGTRAAAASARGMVVVVLSVTMDEL